MNAAFDLTEAAARVVADLMPIAVTVHGPGAAAFAEALTSAGAASEVLAEGQSGFDLAVLLASKELGVPAATATAAHLATVSDRILFVPVPLATTDLPDMDSWFEVFAEQGYQPVVEYDATFLGQGAFLVDRNATAAESELANFAERVTLGGALAASTQRVAALEAELGEAGDRNALKNALSERDAALAARQAELSAALARAERAETEAAALRDQIGAWEVVGQWVSAWVGSKKRGGLASLRLESGRTPRRPFLKRWSRGPIPADATERRLLDEAELVRGSKLFDPVWYIASQPELAKQCGDPVWHYLLKGAPAGADPGPWFNAADYRQQNPDLQGNALVHAIKTSTPK